MTEQNEAVEPSETPTATEKLHKLFDFFFQLGGGSIKVDSDGRVLSTHSSLLGENTPESEKNHSQREDNSQQSLDNSPQPQSVDDSPQPQSVENSPQPQSLDDSPQHNDNSPQSEEVSPQHQSDCSQNDEDQSLTSVENSPQKGENSCQNKENPLQSVEQSLQHVENSPERESHSPSLLQSTNEQSFIESVQPIKESKENNIAENLRQKEDHHSSDNDGEDEFNQSVTRQVIETFSPRNKKLKRYPYSHEERVKILKYIVDRDEYPRVKGRDLWIIMSAREVCETRTWQSMKEHFMKKIVYELDKYEFLTKEQKRRLRISAFNI